jgi:hypothetical protein
LADPSPLSAITAARVAGFERLLRAANTCQVWTIPAVAKLMGNFRCRSQGARFAVMTTPPA